MKVRTQLDAIIVVANARAFKLRCRGLQHFALACFWLSFASVGYALASKIWELNP